MADMEIKEIIFVGDNLLEFTLYVLCPIFRYSMMLAALLAILFEPLTFVFNAKCRTTNILLTTEYLVQFLA